MRILFAFACLFLFQLVLSAELDPTKHQSVFKAALEKFKPTIYIHKKEPYFPTPLEYSCANTFKGLTDKQLADGSRSVHLDNYGYRSFKNNAPLYVNVRKSKEDPKKWWLVYAVWQAYNDCGPDGRLTTSIGGVGIKNAKITLCPGGVHEGDWEHVTVETDSTLQNIQRVYIAFHSFGRWYKREQLHWDGTHPVAYMAKGSHALYRRPGAIKYMKLFEEITKKKIVPCGVKLCKKSLPSSIKICSKRFWGAKFKYPCGIKTSKRNIPCGVKTCNLELKAALYFTDYTPKSTSSVHAYKWNGAKIRWLHTNDEENPGLSAPERAMAKFQGRGGQKIKNDGWRKLKKGVLCATTPIRKISKKIDKKIKGVFEEFGGEYESKASSGLGSKGWWSGKGDKEDFSTDI